MLVPEQFAVWQSDIPAVTVVFSASVSVTAATEKAFVRLIHFLIITGREIRMVGRQEIVAVVVLCRDTELSP